MRLHLTYDEKTIAHEVDTVLVPRIGETIRMTTYIPARRPQSKEIELRVVDVIYKLSQSIGDDKPVVIVVEEKFPKSLENEGGLGCRKGHSGAIVRKEHIHDFLPDGAGEGRTCRICGILEELS